MRDYRIFYGKVEGTLVNQIISFYKLILATAAQEHGVEVVGRRVFSLENVSLYSNTLMSITH